MNLNLVLCIEFFIKFEVIYQVPAMKVLKITCTWKPASVAETQCTLTRTVCQKEVGSIPKSLSLDWADCARCAEWLAACHHACLD